MDPQALKADQVCTSNNTKTFNTNKLFCYYFCYYFAVFMSFVLFYLLFCFILLLCV